ncbi:hypothetical protein Bpfe_023028, partial [Biomphalaria pfeifferi]
MTPGRGLRSDGPPFCVGFVGECDLIGDFFRMGARSKQPNHNEFSQMFRNSAGFINPSKPSPAKLFEHIHPHKKEKQKTSIEGLTQKFGFWKS